MDDFDLRFVQMYERLNAEKMQTLSDVEFERKSLASDRAFHGAIQTRGRVLTMAAELENLICDCIVSYFMPEPGPQQDRFRVSILEKEYCSFSAKNQILKDAHEFLGKSEKHPRWEKLQKLMNLRNIFAHGRIQIDWETQDVSIKHSKGTDSANELFRKFWDSYSVSWTEVWAFLQRIKKNPKDLNNKGMD